MAFGHHIGRGWHETVAFPGRLYAANPVLQYEIFGLVALSGPRASAAQFKPPTLVGLAQEPGAQWAGPLRADRFSRRGENVQRQRDVLERSLQNSPAIGPTGFSGLCRSKRLRKNVLERRCVPSICGEEDKGALFS